jgi:hypothetical protein
MITEGLKAIARCLDSANIPYMVMGGQAVLQYGEARFTRDIDITVALTPDEADRLILSLRSCGFATVPVDVAGFIAKTWVLPVEQNETGIPVDIVFSILPFERQAIEDARVVNIDGVPVKFIPPEELVVQKLIAGRPRDVEDVEGIVEIQGTSLDKSKIYDLLDGFGKEMGNPDLVKTWNKIIGG